MKAKLIAALLATGWEADRHGSYRKTIQGRLYRVKMQDRSCRIECQYIIPADRYSPERKDWSRIGGDYYANMIEMPDGRVRAGTYFFGVKG